MEPTTTTSSGKKKGKPKLNRTQLELHGIEYDETIDAIDELEGWLRPICHSVTRLPTGFSELVSRKFEQEL